MQSFKTLFGFIRKRFLAILLLVVFVLILLVINNILADQYHYSLPKDKSTLILGDSHFVHGCDTNIIKNSVNIAQEAEPWVLSYFKLKAIRKYSPNLKNIVIPISPDNFKSRFKTLFTDNVFASEYFRRSLFITKYSDFKYLGISKFVYIENFIRYKIILNFTFLRNYFSDEKELPYIGEFIGVEADKTVKQYDFNKIIREEFEEDPKDSKIINITYLDSICDYAAKNKINVYLIGVPLRRGLYEVMPPYITNYVDSLTKKISQKENVNYLQLFDSCDDSLFTDYSHLNINGAKFLSSRINDAIEKKQISDNIDKK